jgi:hypothetical protein
VSSRLDEGRIEAVLECHSERPPAAVELRLPHPAERRAISVSGGSYDPTRERVRIEPFAGRAEVVLRFSAD